MAALVLAGIALIPPLRIVELADPGWRIPLIVHAGIVGAISHLVVARVKGWNLSLSLLPVTVFAFTAIPYPGGFENALIRKLTGSVISLTSEVFLLAGRPVEVLGERLTMGSEVVAVTDGCSGIRSLQSLVMASLFFGELLLLPIWKRILLVAVGAGCAVFVNTGRAWWLAATQFDQGRQAAGEIHDMVGNLAFLLSAGILFGTAWLLQRRRSSRRVVVRRVGPTA